MRIIAVQNDADRSKVFRLLTDAEGYPGATHRIENRARWMTPTPVRVRITGRKFKYGPLGTRMIRCEIVFLADDPEEVTTDHGWASVTWNA